MIATALKLFFGKFLSFGKGLLGNTIVQYVLIALIAGGLIWKGFTMLSDWHSNGAISQANTKVEVFKEAAKENEKQVERIQESAQNTEAALTQAQEDKDKVEVKADANTKQADVKIAKITGRYAKDSEAIKAEKDPVVREKKQATLDKSTDEKISEVRINELWGDYCTALAVTGQKHGRC